MRGDMDKCEQCVCVWNKYKKGECKGVKDIWVLKEMLNRRILLYRPRVIKEKGRFFTLRSRTQHYSSI